MPDSANVLRFHALVSGPEGTPYEGGSFYFIVQFPPDYPMSPPRLRLMTTGGGTVRFNPNLYSNGKVCLSILGTWAGPGWSPAQTLSSVLLSVQSLMGERPYANEPGFEVARSEAAVEDYNNVIAHETLRVACLGNLYAGEAAPASERGAAVPASASASASVPATASAAAALSLPMAAGAQPVSPSPSVGPDGASSESGLGTEIAPDVGTALPAPSASSAASSAGGAGSPASPRFAAAASLSPPLPEELLDAARVSFLAQREALVLRCEELGARLDGSRFRDPFGEQVHGVFRFRDVGQRLAAAARELEAQAVPATDAE